MTGGIRTITISIIIQENLPNPPISASYHQDTILRIQADCQWQVYLTHIVIQGWFSKFGFPTINMEHIAGVGIYVDTVVVYIVFCINNIHFIGSPFKFNQVIIIFKKHFKQFAMSLLFCVILCYEIFFPSFFPILEFVKPYGKI